MNWRLQPLHLLTWVHIYVSCLYRFLPGIPLPEGERCQTTKPNEDGSARFIADLVERDVPSAEIDRRLDFSCDRIRQIVATHGLPDTRTHAARHRASRVRSNRQARILAFIRDYTAANSFSPSLREIAEGLRYKQHLRRHHQSNCCELRAPSFTPK